jgi:uncharacterized protein
MKILITGGTGLIGSRLTEMLLKKNHEVSYLSREKKAIPNVKVFQWKIEENYIENGALENVDFIVHLAGAGIADKRWTDARKQEIIDSRIKPISLIINELQKAPQPPEGGVKGFICGSAIGFYGGDSGEKRLTENSKAGDDFLAKCTTLWEKSADELQKKFNVRTVKIRTGIALSKYGGALPKIVLPIKFGFGAALGSGKQWLSWIHLDDLCNIFIKAIEDENMNGAYNAVAPNPATNLELTKLSAKILKKIFWLPNIPKFLLNLALGEMAVVVVGGNFVLNKRLANETDFKYQFPEIEKALEDLLIS